MEIYIFGAGEFGKYVYQKLDGNLFSVLGYIDNNPDKIGRMLMGQNIYGLQHISLAKKRVASFLIAVTSDKAKMEILKQLEAERIEHVYLVSPQVWYKKADVIKDNKFDNHYLTKIIRGETGVFLPVLPYLETHVMDGCCLKCKGCSHFSNLFETYDEVSFVQYKNDIEQLKRICNIERLRLLGGEPLLHSQFLDFVKISRESFPNANIRVVTNGLLITKMSAEVFNYMSEHNIGFDITVYHSTRKKERDIVNCLNFYNIDYYLLKGKNNKFNKILTLNDNHDREKTIEFCSRKTCLILKEGKLYRCPVSAYVYKFNEKFGTDIKSESIFDIYEDSIDKLTELSIGRKIVPVNTCDYCAEQVVEYAWSVSKNPSIHDWLIDEE